MILGDKPSTLERGSIMGERAMTITANAKAFNILLDKLYSNKEGAVVREICTNAYDAMIDAGKSSQPFRISIPDSMDHNFVVSDDGVGLSEEQVHDLIGGVFNSSKDNNNNTAGAFGLGSKCPFALTDSFSIESRFNGVKMHFIAFKNEQGVPAVLKTGEEPTEDCNGVTISIPVPQDSYQRFEREVRKQLQFFDPKPIVVNREDYIWDDETVFIAGDGYTVYESESYGASVMVKMGPVGYEVESRHLPSMREVMEAMRRKRVVLHANMGDVDIPPSREALEYTPRTIAFLEGAVDRLLFDSVRQIVNAVVKVEGFYQKVVKARKFHESYSQRTLIKYRDSLGANGLTEDDVDRINAIEMIIDPRSFERKKLADFTYEEVKAKTAQQGLDGQKVEPVKEIRDKYRIMRGFPTASWRNALPHLPTEIYSREYNDLGGVNASTIVVFQEPLIHIIMDVEDRIIQRLLGVCEELRCTHTSKQIWFWKHTTHYAKHSGKSRVDESEIDAVFQEIEKHAPGLAPAKPEVRLLSSFTPVKYDTPAKPRGDDVLVGCSELLDNKSARPLKWGAIRQAMSQGSKLVLFNLFNRDLAPQHKKWQQVFDSMVKSRGFFPIGVGASASKKTIQLLLDAGAVWIEDWARDINKNGIPKKHQSCIWDTVESRSHVQRMHLLDIKEGLDGWVRNAVLKNATQGVGLDSILRLRAVYDNPWLPTAHNQIQRGAAMVRKLSSEATALAPLLNLLSEFSSYELRKPGVEEAAREIARRLQAYEVQTQTVENVNESN